MSIQRKPFAVEDFSNILNSLPENAFLLLTDVDENDVISNNLKVVKCLKYQVQDPPEKKGKHTVITIRDRLEEITEETDIHRILDPKCKIVEGVKLEMI